jgi:aspartate-semialdehyde dehydrogenase
MKVAVVGATGLVGTVILRVLEERKFPVSELIPVATEKSVGRDIVFKGKHVKIVSMETAIAKHADIAALPSNGPPDLLKPERL